MVLYVPPLSFKCFLMDGNKKVAQNAISLEKRMNYFIQQLISFANDHDDISTEEAIAFKKNILAFIPP